MAGATAAAGFAGAINAGATDTAAGANPATMCGTAAAAPRATRPDPARLTTGSGAETAIAAGGISAGTFPGATFPGATTTAGAGAVIAAAGGGFTPGTVADFTRSRGEAFSDNGGRGGNTSGEEASFSSFTAAPTAGPRRLGCGAAVSVPWALPAASFAAADALTRPPLSAFDAESSADATAVPPTDAAPRPTASAPAPSHE